MQLTETRANMSNSLNHVEQEKTPLTGGMTEPISTSRAFALRCKSVDLTDGKNLSKYLTDLKWKQRAKTHALKRVVLTCFGSGNATEH